MITSMHRVVYQFTFRDPFCLTRNFSNPEVWINTTWGGFPGKCFFGWCPGLLLHVLRRQQSKRRLHLRSGFHNSRLLYRRLNIAWKTASVSGDWWAFLAFCLLQLSDHVTFITNWCCQIGAICSQKGNGNSGVSLSIFFITFEYWLMVVSTGLQVDEWWEQPASTAVDWVTVDGQNVAAWLAHVKQLQTAFYEKQLL